MAIQSKAISSNQSQLIVKYLLIALMIWALVGCGDPASVEDQVRSVIAEMEEAGEAGERGRFMQHVADDFRGQGGEMGRDDFRAYLALQWNQNQRLHAQLFPVTVEPVGDDEARAEFRVLLTGGRGLIPERGQLYDVETWWRLEGDDWRLSAANWSIAVPGG